MIAKLDTSYVALLLVFKGSVTAMVFDANGNIMTNALVYVANHYQNTSTTG